MGADIKKTALVLKRSSENGVLRYVKEARQNRYSRLKANKYTLSVRNFEIQSTEDYISIDIIGHKKIED